MAKAPRRLPKSWGFPSIRSAPILIGSRIRFAFIRIQPWWRLHSELELFTELSFSSGCRIGAVPFRASVRGRQRSNLKQVRSAVLNSAPEGWQAVSWPPDPVLRKAMPATEPTFRPGTAPLLYRRNGWKGPVGSIGKKTRCQAHGGRGTKE